MNMKTPTERVSKLFLDDPFIFISYGKEDRQKVLKSYDRLVADNLKPWMDVHNIPPGYVWANLISTTIKKSRFFLVFLSNKSVGKTGFIQKEISDALKVVETQPEGQVYVIPIRLEECDVPERLAKWHWIDIYKYGGYNRLKDTLIYRLGSLYQPATPNRVPDFKPESPSFEAASDYLIYKHFSSKGAFIYGRLDNRKVAMSDGCFLEIRSSVPKSFLKLKPSCSRFAKLSSEALHRVFPSAESYRHEDHKVSLIEKHKDNWRLVLKSKSGKQIVGVNPFYWNYMQLRFPNAVSYLIAPLSPIVFEENNKIVGLIMPMALN